MDSQSVSNPANRAMIGNWLGRIKCISSWEGVREIRLFGSAAKGVAPRPRDIDVAIICDESNWRNVGNSLKKMFPNAKVDFGDYTRTEDPLPGEPRLHFVLASDRIIRQMSRLALAIQQGFCLI